MSNDRNHSEQFERYLKGQMSPEEAHAFEHEVLDDLFALEALEGYETQSPEAINDLKKLRSKVLREKRSFPFMRLAAAIALLIAGSYTVFYFTNDIEDDQLVMEKEQMEEMSQSAPKPDTISISDTSESVKTGNQKPDPAELDIAPKRPVQKQVAENTRQEIEEPETLDQEDEMIAEAAEPDINPEEAEMAEGRVANALQGKAAGVQAKSPGLMKIDTNALDEVVITAQPLVAKRESLNFAASDVSEDSIEKDKKSGISRPAARSRSMASSIVTGRVSDDYGEALPGVNVIIKGTTTGVTTDLDGNYQIPKTDNQTLVFSYVGFESQEVEVGSRSTVDVTMGGATELQEVVVTGYGGVDADVSPSYSPASPSTGNRAYKEYLENNLQYPEAARENAIEGTVVLELTIDPSGQISNIDIKKSLGYGCDEEALRLINEGPKWEAANKDGTSVEDKVRVRVKFNR